MSAWEPRTTVRDRFAVIREHVARGSVLDVGVVRSRPAVQPTPERIEALPDSLFKRIVELNPEALGVDVDAVGIGALRAKGYNVEHADAQTMDLGRRFDTIVAGETIEHLENPGQFLRNLRRHARPGGVLILSTPNPFYLKQTWKILRGKPPEVHEEHTVWFDPITLGQLLIRTGWQPEQAFWIQPARRPWTWLQAWRGSSAHSFLVLAR
jgi:SAM-dependent methyltransferase